MSLHGCDIQELRLFFWTCSLPMHFKIAVFCKLFLSMMHVHLMEVELGQWAKSCRLVLISKSDHCQKTFELTLTYIYVVSLKMFSYSQDETKYCALSLPSLSMPPGSTLLNWLLCLHLREDTYCTTVDHFGSQNSISALVLLNYVLILCMARPVPRYRCWPHCILVCLFIAFLVLPGTTCRDYENGALHFIYIFIPVVYGYLASIWLSTCTINHYRTPIHCLRTV
jgi:hypothetical protein